ncbi:hypothetical protein HK405_010186, partial [Cladochytrium tenue]
ASAAAAAASGNGTADLGGPDYLRMILTVNVYDVAIEPGLQKAMNLSSWLGKTVLLKREDLHPVFSVKRRGAHNRMQQLSDAERRASVINGDLYVIAGQGTLGVDIQRRPLRGPTDPATADAARRHRLRLRRWRRPGRGRRRLDQARLPRSRHRGIETYVGNNALAAGWLAGVGLFADRAAVRSVGVKAFHVCSELVDEMVLVGTDEICEDPVSSGYCIENLARNEIHPEVPE